MGPLSNVPALRRLALATVVVLALLALAASLARRPAAALEGTVFDLAQRAARPSAPDGVLWVDTGASTDRGVLASAVRIVNGASPRAITLLLPLESAETNPDLARVRDFLASPGAHADPALEARLNGWLAELDHDERLAAAIQSAPVVLSMAPGQNAPRPPPLPARPADLASIAGVALPAERFASAAKALGLEPAPPVDADGVRRQDPLLVQAHGEPVASLAFATWLVAGGDRPDTVRAEAHALTAGPSGRRLAFGGGTRVLPMYAAPAGDGDGLTRMPLEALLATPSDTARLQGRIVVIGHGPDVATPLGSRPAAEAAAERVASLEAQNYALVPSWALALRALIFVLAVLWASEGAWRLAAARGVLTAVTATLVLALLALVLEVVLLVQFAAWARLVLPALATVLAAATVGLLGPLFQALPGERVLAEPVMLVPQTQQKSRAAARARAAPPPRPRPDPLPTVAMPAGRRAMPAPPAAPPRGEAPADASQSSVPRSLRQISESLKPVEPSRADVADLLLGRTKRAARPKLGRYELVEELGRGAMGTVFLGRDPRLNRVVALKVIPLAEAVDENNLAETRARFFREAEAAGRLKHPAIVTVYDAGEDGGLAYIAMEHVQGEPLVERTVSDRLLEPAVVLEVVARLADALQYAHAQGVIHRDVKPGNVIYDPATLEPKIMDFGIARFTDSTTTRTGIVLGTPSFMAPEQLEGRNVTGRSDLFALGVTLFQLLTGQLPFRADSMTALMDKIANAPHPPLRTIRPDLPASVGVILDRALQKDPDQRFTDGAEMAKALRAVAKALP